MLQWTRPGDGFLGVRVSGALGKADLEGLLDAVERAARQPGRPRLLVELADFRGCTPGGGWEGVERDLAPLAGVDRLAVVGDPGWQATLAGFCQPFATAVIRFYGGHRRAEACGWLNDRRRGTEQGPVHPEAASPAAGGETRAGA